MYFILVLFISFSFNQNFNYSSEDWFTISNPGYITSISLAGEEVLFSAENGIYSYNKYTSELLFLEDFVRNFEAKSFHMIHYDAFRDYLWVLTEENISYKPYSSTFWRTIDFYELDLNNHYSILNLGSNSEYLFINLGSDILVLDPYTGILVTEEINDYSDVEWTGNSRNNLSNDFDLTMFHSFEGYSFISNSRIEHMGRFLEITDVAADNQNIWVGTNSGEIFVCDISMRSVEKIKSMPLFSDMRLSYIDDRDEWWFATNDKIALYKDIVLANDQIFILRWIENENKWISYNQNKYPGIASSDITCFYRDENFLYIGTYFGLLAFNINRKKWELIDADSGLAANHITKLSSNDGMLYVATTSGLNMISLRDNEIVKNNYFNDFLNMEIKDLKIEGNSLFILSQNGISLFDLPEKKYEIIVEGKFTQFIFMENFLILSKKNKIVKYNMVLDKKNTLMNIKSIHDVSLCNDYLWISAGDHCILLNLITNETFKYDLDDGIVGSIVRQVDCDDGWVWFTGNKGISFYNWFKYHD